jgi:hypothetical protein
MERDARCSCGIYHTKSRTSTSSNEKRSELEKGLGTVNEERSLRPTSNRSAKLGRDQRELGMVAAAEILQTEGS